MSDNTVENQGTCHVHGTVTSDYVCEECDKAETKQRP